MSMNVDTARERRAVLEQKFCDMLREFEKATGCVAYSINLDRVVAMGEASMVSSVSIDVELGRHPT